MRNVTRYVERLLRQRRPRPFIPTDDEAEALTAAITLRAARPEQAIPRGEFVTALHRRLADEAARAGEAEPASGAGTAGLVTPAGARPRRGLLIGTAVSAATAAAGAVVGWLLPGREGAPVAAPTLEPASGTWHPVLASAELAEGGSARFDAGTVTGFLTRAGGAVSARSGVCTHQGCRLDLAGQRLACPCHKTFFRLDGTVITSQLPAPPARLPAIRVREQGGTIEVYVPDAS